MTSNIAFVFPGQGSQAVGMLNGFAAEYPEIVNAACAEASAVLGYDMAELIATDPEQKLQQTEYTQPALLTAGVIAWRIWQSESELRPKVLAGHSLGEYTALVCANAISFADGLRLVAKRGELMQTAVPMGTGAMAAILGLELEQVNSLCAEVTAENGMVVQAANLNAPGQIVIAGNAVAVAIAIERAKAIGAKRALSLPVSVPSHCHLMIEAATQFAEYLEAVQWQQPEIKVIHNYDVASHNAATEICAALQKQLYNPVRWIETVESFVSQGVTEIIECGPGKVLAGLNKRIAPEVETQGVIEGLGAKVC